MIPRRSPFPWCRTLAVVLLTSFIAWSAPAAAQIQLDPSPYVFFLFDTSGSMNYSPPCTQDQVDDGSCGFLCPTGDCFVPMQGDDPASKIFQLKEALFTSIAYRPNDDLLLGFASFNQDSLNVRYKHWLYQATSDGPQIPGGPAYPATGAQEVFGYNWGCNTGSGNNQTGCSGSFPASLSDPWQAARVQRVPKGGAQLTQTVDVYIRPVGGPNYRVRYAPPLGPVTPGASVITTNVSLARCTNAACSTFTAIGTRSVSWQLVSDFLPWDDSSSSSSTSLNTTNPQLSYFSPGFADDATATNTCSGWDPNNDTTADRVSSSIPYSLRWPTDNTDTRGSLFSVGDVIPLDWNASHSIDIQQRLAPNLMVGSASVPDFRTATYLNDSRLGTDTFLRLRKEVVRPLIAAGSSPLAASLSSFRTWYTGCPATCPPSQGWQGIARFADPDWASRHVSLVVLTDGGDTCVGDPCAHARALYTNYGVKTYIVAFGAQPVSGSAIECAAAAGGTGAPYYPQTERDLIETLGQIYAAAALP
jgi:hypothetical protein